MMNSLFIDTLPSQTFDLVTVLQKEQPVFFKHFYLSGGTALSLQLGHRKSEDLDFFSKENFNPEALQKELLNFGMLTETELATGTLNTFINGVKLQFLEYPYQLLESTHNWEGIELSSIIDIACTKLQTVGMRGSKKDFIDLYFLFEHYSLFELLMAVQKKYSDINYSQTHILKSLTYFEDAELQPMPRMHKNVSWDQVKEKMKQVVKSIDF